jgi:Secretion system C-terminal sorting domain/Bacterial Ig-like domain
MTKKIYKVIAIILIFIATANNVNSQIVFTDVEPDVTVNEFLQGYAINFDNDDKIDAHLTLLDGGGIVWTMLLIPDDNEDANYVVNQGGNDGGAKVLNIGDEISPSSDYFIIGDGWGDLLYGYWVDDGEYGYWTDTQTEKYLGFKFDIDGSYHYGWVHLSTIIHATDDMEFTIHSYAYNSVPDEVILAGDEGEGVIVKEPTHNAIDVEFNATVSANFSYDISVIDLSAVTIKNAENVAVTGVVAVLEADNQTITISHDDFVENTTYTVTIPENSVQDGDLNGNVEIVWNFTTKLAENILEQNSEISVFPNPTTGTFTINNLKASERPLSVEIIDITGKVVNSQPVTQNSQLEFDLSAYPKGIYIIRINSEDKVFTSKLILK